ncbi:ferredoxin reductase family protein [Deinococcus planocerae]|uniref:ferredoxin reductase family protein n=1 Tax=Deinococcus planocerae TaxID=1737569 RepID=UPI000C7F4429|nr:ferric reductase-like transmembrane domain-containing protein [Deinococcus planocerae]
MSQSQLPRRAQPARQGPLSRTTIGVLWTVLYALIALSPLLTILIGPEPVGRDFWTEFSVALGFVGMSVMCLQFLITARFRRITAPYGIDMLLQFHRQISFVAFALVLAHPLILFVTRPETLALLNPVEAPWRARFAVLSVLALVALVVTSVWRVNLKLGYETWRIVHGLLSVLVIGLALAHMVGVGHYLGTPWKAALWTAMGVGVALLVLYVRVLKPFLLRTRPYRVSGVREERGDSYTLSLTPEGHRGLRFRPGQFAWIRVGESPLSVRENPFSFSGSAEERGEVHFTIKALGDFTRTVKDVPVGTRAYVDGPYGVFTPDYLHRDQGFVLIAGGVGITPMISILRTLADRGDERPVLLLYASKAWDGVTFREELDKLQSRLNLRVVHVLNEAPEGWTGETGFVNRDLLEKYLPDDRRTREYFLCGPPPMMDAVTEVLSDLGVPLTHVHAEQFNLV